MAIGRFKHCMGSPPEYAVHEQDTYTDWFDTDVSNTGRWCVIPARL